MLPMPRWQKARGQNGAMIEQLLDEISAIGWRLVSLSDMSVAGQSRWWATLHRTTAAGLEVKFGEAGAAGEALFKAFAAVPTVARGTATLPAPIRSALESDEDGEGLDF